MNLLRSFARNWAFFIGIVVVWQLVTAAVRSPFFPTPATIADHLGRLLLTDAVVHDILPSVGRILGGWLIAVAIGVTLGTALGLTKTGMAYVGSLFAFFRAIPPPALIPVFMILFGIDTTMKLATIVFGALWPVLLNTVDGVRSVDPVKTDIARAFRISPHLRLFMIVIPAALPKIFAGLRISLSIALLLMVVSEMVGVTNGIGYQLRYAQDQFSFPDMWAWVVLLGALGYVFNTLLLVLERRALHWQSDSNIS
ncbi:ABC transporter permease [Kibdelosporangium aridum]|uniref:ABC transporter permease n=1 Tax=Kibdelosporangium aridum TaxID=2030 RepID=UPI0005247A88